MSAVPPHAILRPLLLPLLLAVAPFAAAAPVRAEAVLLSGPGLATSTCGLEYGAPKTPCETTFSLQIEAAVPKSAETLPDDAPCAQSDAAAAAEERRIAAAFLDAARARAASGGAARIVAGLVGAAAQGVAARAPAPVRQAIARNFQPDQGRATCGVVMALLPADAVLVGHDFTETGRDSGTGSCFSEGACLNGGADFLGPPAVLAKDAAAQVLATRFKNWSSQDRVARLLLFFTLPPGATVQVAR